MGYLGPDPIDTDECGAYYSVLQSFMDENNSTFEEIEFDLKRRLFGDGYVESMYSEHKGDTGESRIQSVFDVYSKSYGADKKTEPQMSRVHFKGRGKTERPTCPTCQQDLKRSYETAPDWKKGKVPYGWHCSKCKYQIFD